MRNVGLLAKKLERVPGTIKRCQDDLYFYLFFMCIVPLTTCVCRHVDLGITIVTPQGVTSSEIYEYIVVVL